MTEPSIAMETPPSCGVSSSTAKEPETRRSRHRSARAITPPDGVERAASSNGRGAGDARDGGSARPLNAVCRGVLTPDPRNQAVSETGAAALKTAPSDTTGHGTTLVIPVRKRKRVSASASPRTSHSPISRLAASSAVARSDRLSPRTCFLAVGRTAATTRT